MITSKLKEITKKCKANMIIAPIFGTMLLVTSCSSIRNVDSGSIPISSSTWTKSALTCLGLGVLSGFIAKRYSPNKQSEGANMLVFGASGCVIGGSAAGAINHLKEKEDFLKEEKNTEYLYQNHISPLGGVND